MKKKGKSREMEQSRNGLSLGGYWRKYPKDW
jgi:hypothetical protein